MVKTDIEIKNDVRDELIWEPNVSEKEINIDVNNGVVTLTGNVDAYPKKVAAQTAAERVAGVTRVINDIEVKIISTFQRSDSEIEQAVHVALKGSVSIPAASVKVKVKDGWVTLEGNLEWDFQKKAVTRLVEDLIGVKGVINAISIAVTIPTATDVKEKIESALKRNININGERINVEVIGNKVVLSGKVRSFSEKYSAEIAAWSAPGVGSVNSKLEVSPSEVYA
ncbi:MAG: BON domain-containing protein [Bacteroidia bacterium]